jgi:hypothetical protein
MIFKGYFIQITFKSKASTHILQTNITGGINEIKDELKSLQVKINDIIQRFV